MPRQSEAYWSELYQKTKNSFEAKMYMKISFQLL